MKRLLSLLLVISSFSALAQNNNSDLAKQFDYYPENYGAKGDIKRAYVNTKANSTTVTASAATWTTSDVGKKIKIAWCGAAAGAAHNDLITTITGVTNANTITVASAPTASNNDAMCYFGTDDTKPMQSCINAAAVANRGRVVLTKMYLIAGPVIDTISVSGVGKVGYHSQLTIPFHSYTNADETRGYLQFDGIIPPGFSDNGPGTYGATRPSMAASGWVSFVTSSDSMASVIASAGPPSTNGFNYAYVGFKNMKVMVPSNGDGVGQGIGGINMGRQVASHIESVIVNVDDNLMYTAMPIYHHFGINLNDIMGDNGTYLNLVHVYGAYKGFCLGEHDYFGAIGAFGCYYPVELKQMNFMVSGNMLTIHWCKRGFLATGQTAINLAMCNLEGGLFSNNRHSGPSWFSTDADGLFDDLGVPQRGTFYCTGRIVLVSTMPLKIGPWFTQTQIVSPGQLSQQN
jgi:hypothetical protein